MFESSKILQLMEVENSKTGSFPRRWLEATDSPTSPWPEFLKPFCGLNLKRSSSLPASHLSHQQAVRSHLLGTFSRFLGTQQACTWPSPGSFPSPACFLGWGLRSTGRCFPASRCPGILLFDAISEVGTKSD